MKIGCVVALLVAGLAAPAQAAVRLVSVGDFSRPVFVAGPPNDARRAFVVERGGAIRIVKDGATLPRPFLDLGPAGANLVATDDGRGTERGLLSMAFASADRFYVYYTARAPAVGDIQIDEFHADPADPDHADPATRRRLVTIGHSQFANHNGGQLALGPDGMLWAATGDGGGAGDPLGNAQNPATLLGKLLRIDPATGSVETWAMGLRNPFRFSFDRATGDLVIGDVGQDFAEEIDFAARSAGLGHGANYGWNRVEGGYRYNPLTPGQLQPATPADYPSGYVAPVVERLHSEGWCSITGGYVVRDPSLPDLAGRYVYGDWCKGDIYATTLPGGGPGTSTGLHVEGLSSFGEDGCGRVYAMSIDGPVHRLEDPTQPSACVETQPPAGSGDQAPVVTLRAARRQRAARTGFVALRVGCDEDCRVRAAGRISVLRARRAAASRRVLPARTAPVSRTVRGGSSAAMRLRLARAVRRAVRRALRRPGRRVIAAVTVIAQDAGGNVVRRAATVQVTG